MPNASKPVTSVALSSLKRYVREARIGVLWGNGTKRRLCPCTYRGSQRHCRKVDKTFVHTLYLFGNFHIGKNTNYFLFNYKNNTQNDRRGTT